MPASKAFVPETRKPPVSVEIVSSVMRNSCADWRSTLVCSPLADVDDPAVLASLIEPWRPRLSIA